MVSRNAFSFYPIFAGNISSRRSFPPCFSHSSGFKAGTWKLSVCFLQGTGAFLHNNPPFFPTPSQPCLFICFIIEKEKLQGGVPASGNGIGKCSRGEANTCKVLTFPRTPKKMDFCCIFLKTCRGKVHFSGTLWLHGKSVIGHGITGTCQNAALPPGGHDGGKASPSNTLHDKKGKGGVSEG